MKTNSNFSTTIIAGFPGVGKSYLFDNRIRPARFKVSDSDSSNFSWIVDSNGNKVRNPDFPNNYIKHIKKLIAEGYNVIFTSTHAAVLQAMLDNNIEFTIAAPERQLKEEYLKRYQERGNDQSFIDLMDKNWDNFLDDIDKFPVKKVYLKSNEYIKEAF